MTSKKTLDPSCCCRLNPVTFEAMVNDILTKLYGHLEGRPYDVDESALKSLQQSAESFIETMWRQVKEIMIEDNNRQIIDKHDFDLWKSRTGFKLRVQTHRGSLCRLFDNIKKYDRNRKRKRGYEYN